MFEIKRYSEADKEVWNAHVEQARNATFLLNRSYMDYHSDRFHDHSLMIFRNGKLYALLPANEAGDTFFSHQGLTYAGLLTTEHASAEDICQVFVAINTYLKQAGTKYHPPRPENHHHVGHYRHICHLSGPSCTAHRVCRKNVSREDPLCRDRYRQVHYI